MLCDAGRTLRFRFILTLSFSVHKLDDEDGIIFEVPLSTGLFHGETYLTEVANHRIRDKG